MQLHHHKTFFVPTTYKYIEMMNLTFPFLVYFSVFAKQPVAKKGDLRFLTAIFQPSITKTSPERVAQAVGSISPF